MRQKRGSLRRASAYGGTRVTLCHAPEAGAVGVPRTKQTESCSPGPPLLLPEAAALPAAARFTLRRYVSLRRQRVRARL